MADVVELMDFWSMDDDENIGFVAADSDFQLWLINGIGVSFEDISYSVIDGPDSSGIYELIMDYDDYTTLSELYDSYLGDNEYGAEEDSTPVMDPMDFGEPVNWTPMDGTPSLKRRKDAESTGDGNASGYVTFYWTWEMNHPEDYEPNEYDINDEIKGAAEDGEIGWYSFNHDGHEVEAHITQGEQYFDAEYNVEEDEEIGYLCDVCDEPTQADYNFQDINVKWTLEDGDFTGEYEMKDHLGDFNDFLCQPCAERMNYEAEGMGEINIGPVYVTKKVPVLFKHDYVTRDYEWSTDEPSYLTDDQESEVVEIVEDIVEDSDEEEGDETFDEYDYQGEVTWNTYKDDGRFYDLGAEGATGDQIAWIEAKNREIEQASKNPRKNERILNKYMEELSNYIDSMSAEGANPSGGATGDQIIAWEHNGLSSPSGPPSDIFWSEGDYGEYVQIFDTTITKKGIEEKLQRAGIKPIEVFSVYEDGTKSKDIFGVYLKEGDAKIFSREFSKNDWTGLFDFEGTVSFAAHMGHSRFQQSNNPRRDMGSTRRKLKQEMFSDVSGVVTLKNMAVLGLAGITGYLIAGRN